MFKLVVHCLKKMFGGAEEAPRQAPRQKNNSGNAAKRPPRNVPSGRPGQAKAPYPPPDNNRRTGAKKPRREKQSAIPGAVERKAPAPLEVAAPKPARPEKLGDVPQIEGKMRFLDLPLAEDVQFSLQNSHFEYCTPIQAMAIPELLSGHDIAAKAQTGTGKTAAFLLSIFTKLLQNPKPDMKKGTCRALVLAPTRELAMQIHKDAMELGIFTGLNPVVVFGGMDHKKQELSLDSRVDMLIGTPGRIIDYARSGSLNLHETEYLVIDEADRMLDMGFIPDVRRIVAQLPPREKRETMLFSATLEPSVLALASSFQNHPVLLESEPEQMVCSTIEQTFYSVSGHEKLPLLLWILEHDAFDRVMIFGNRKDKNLALQTMLARYGHKVELLSGDVAQEKRIRILERFRSGESKVLIATDVAARGIHVDDVSIVVNYDLPEQPEDYVHRIGRTGRAGHKGKSISFICEYGAYTVPALEKLLGFTVKSVFPEDEMVQMPAVVDPTIRVERAASRGARPRGGYDRRGSSRPRRR